MKLANQYVEYIKDLLGPFGIDGVKFMFGGYGVYKNGVMFALIAYNELYLKSNPSSGEFYEKHGSKQFEYMKNDVPCKMSYWYVPPEILESAEDLNLWLEKAYEVALLSRKMK